MTEYELRVGGTSTGDYGGLYFGKIALGPVASVPEPEIYAMLAVGPGIMGWAERGKKRKSPVV